MILRWAFDVLGVDVGTVAAGVKVGDIRQIS
jgi:hypothetical protein